MKSVKLFEVKKAIIPGLIKTEQSTQYHILM